MLELNCLVLAVSHLYTHLSVHSLENDSAVTSSLSTHRLRPLYSPAPMSLEWALWIVPFINDNLLLFKLVNQILSHLELRSSVIDCLFSTFYTGLGLWWCFCFRWCHGNWAVWWGCVWWWWDCFGAIVEDCLGFDRFMLIQWLTKLCS